MPIYNGVKTYTVTNGGGTVNIDLADPTTTRYYFSGTATLGSSYTIQGSGTPKEGMEVVIIWSSACTIGANTVTVFGQLLTASQALNNLVIRANYTNAAWVVNVEQDNGITCTNGLTTLAGGAGLGGALTQDTTVTSTSTNTFQVTHTAGSANGNDVNFIMGEGAPGVTSNGISFLSSSSDIFGSIARVTNAGVDELLMSFSDVSASVTNGLKVIPTNFSLRAYDPTGATKVGFTGYDGTLGFDLAANMFYNDVALDLDIAHIQCKSTEALMRYAYVTTPGSEEHNRIIVNGDGITLDATGGIADDQFITVTGYLQNFANDAAASAGGVPVGALYRNGSVVMIRVA
jgi:hypothetical protein